jgi:hypothetical protein
MAQCFLKPEEAEVGVRAGVIDKDGTLIDEVQIENIQYEDFQRTKPVLVLKSFNKYPGGHTELMYLPQTGGWHSFIYDIGPGDHRIVNTSRFQSPFKLDLYTTGQLRLF